MELVQESDGDRLVRLEIRGDRDELKGFTVLMLRALTTGEAHARIGRTHVVVELLGESGPG